MGECDKEGCGCSLKQESDSRRGAITWIIEPLPCSIDYIQVFADEQNAENFYDLCGEKVIFQTVMKGFWKKVFGKKYLPPKEGRIIFIKYDNLCLPILKIGETKISVYQIKKSISWSGHRYPFSETPFP